MAIATLNDVVKALLLGRSSYAQSVVGQDWEVEKLFSCSKQLKRDVQKKLTFVKFRNRTSDLSGVDGCCRADGESVIDQATQEVVKCAIETAVQKPLTS